MTRQFNLAFATALSAVVHLTAVALACACLKWGVRPVILPGSADGEASFVVTLTVDSAPGHVKEDVVVAPPPSPPVAAEPPPLSVTVPEPEPPPPEPAPEPEPLPRPEPAPEPTPKPVPPAAPESRSEPVPAPSPPAPPSQVVRPQKSPKPARPSHRPAPSSSKPRSQDGASPARPSARTGSVPTGESGREEGSGSVELATTARPVYPMSARLRGEEGAVKVNVTLRPDGTVKQAEVQVSSGFPALDKSALSALRKARFRAVKGTIDDGAQVLLTIRFRLTDGADPGEAR